MTSAGPFVGRADDLDSLLYSASYVPGGHGSFHLVHGEGGIGKSALLAQFAKKVPLPVVVGRPLDGVPTAPLMPWHRIVHLLAQRFPDDVELRGVLELLTDGDPGLALPGVLFRMSSALLAAARREPFAVVIDDVEALDDASLALLDLLIEDVAAAPFMIVGAFCTTGEMRPASREAFLRWVRRPDTRVTDLGPLSDDEVRRAVRRHLAAEPPSAELVRLARGNPLVALELCRASAMPGPGADLRLDRLVDHRLGPFQADGPLAALALLGRPATVTLLGSITGLPVTAVIEELVAATRSGLVDWSTEVSDLAVVSHVVFADAIRRRLGAAEQEAMHHRIASVLMADSRSDGPSGGASEAATHAILSGRRDEQTIDACLAAARSCESLGALQEALSFLSHAADACPSVHQTMAILHARARVLGRRGDLETSAWLFEQARLAASDLGDEEVVAMILLDRCKVDPRIMEPDHHLARLLERSIELVGERRPDLRLGLLSRLAEAVFLTEPRLSLAYAERAVALSETLVDADYRVVALQQLAVIRCAEPGGGGLRELRDELRRLPGNQAALYATIPDAQLRLQVGNRRSLDEWLLIQHAALERYPIAFFDAYHQLMVACRAFCDADLAALERAIAAVLESGAGPGSGTAMMVMPMHLVWRLHTGAFFSIDVSRMPAMPLAGGFADLLVLGYAVVDALRGDPAAAERVGELLQDPKSIHRDLAWVTWMCLLAVGGAIAGRPSVAVPAAEALIERSAEWATIGPAGLVGPIGYFAAAGFHASGRIAEAVQTARLGLEAARRLEAQHWIVKCSIQVLALDGCADGSERERLRASTAELAARLGLDLVPDDARWLRVESAAGRDREVRVLELAAEGHSNREIAREIAVSEKTVERIFTEIFRRTGTKNRASAVAQLVGRSG